MKFLFDELQINADKTSIAEFIKLITGKEENQKIKDGNIYKILKNPYPKSDKTLIEDLRFIRPYFENLGITAILDKINHEISSKE